MGFIFLDESGDMGFDFTKSKTSQFFIITCLFVANKRPAEKIIRRIVKHLPLKDRIRHSGVLHAHKETVRNRKKLLTELARQGENVGVIAIYLNKKKVYTHLRDQKHVLYNFVANILLDRIYSRHLLPGECVEVIASRRETHTVLNQGFTSYLESQIVNNHHVQVKVRIETPSREKCLQLADFASWAIFRDREHKDDTYRNIITDIIIEDRPLFS